MRNRRVKCDESKPQCKRCQRYGTLCGGYSLPREKNIPLQRTTITAKILPKDQRQIPKLPEVLPICTIHSGLRFDDDKESRCFRIYCEETAVCITGPFTSSLWETLIPQTSEMEPFVRKAAVAVGALAKLSKDKKKSSRTVFLSSNDPDTTYALQKYDEALRGMRRAILRRDHDVRKMLIACLLVFCFETLQGNFLSAISHAERGLMLFIQAMSDPSICRPSPAPSAATKAVERNMLEGDLMHAYAGLDLHIMYFRDTRSEEMHRALIVHQNRQILQMPTTIEDTKEARKYWFLIMRRNYHFLKIASKDAAKNAPQTSLESDESPLDDSYPAMECVMSSPGRPSLDFQDEYESYTEDMRRCSRACSRLYERIRQNGTQAQKLLIDILNVHTKITNIVLTGLFFSSELEYDSFLPDFRKMVSLAKVVHPQLLASAEGSAGFHYGYGINYPLFLVGLKCRDKGLRDEAIKLLGSREHREGTWDAMALASIAGWVRDVEQKCLGPDGFVVETQRVFLTGCNLDLQSRTTTVKAAQRTEAGLAFRKAFIKW